MVPRVLIVLAGFALLISPSLAVNLRKGTAALDEIPADDERTAIVYKALAQNTAMVNDRERKYVEETIAAAHVNARKHVEDLHKAGKLAEMKSKATTLGTNVHVYNGAFVTRRRPNADCSGMVSTITASRVVGDCRSDGFGGSYYLSCAHEDDQGNVQMHSTYFTEEGCMNGWWGDQVVQSEPKCQYYRYGETLDFPSMMAAQCARNDVDIAVQGGGIAFASFAEGDSTCAGPPEFVTVEKYDVCRRGYNGRSDEPTGFFHYTLDSCAAATGRAYVTYYTDGLCLRPVGRDSFTIGGVNDGPPNTCQFDGQGAFAMTMCVPKGGV